MSNISARCQSDRHGTHSLPGLTDTETRRHILESLHLGHRQLQNSGNASKYARLITGNVKKRVCHVRGWRYFPEGCPQHVTNIDWRLRVLTRCIAADAQPEEKHKELKPQNYGGKKLVRHRGLSLFLPRAVESSG